MRISARLVTLGDTAQQGIAAWGVPFLESRRGPSVTPCVLALPTGVLEVVFGIAARRWEWRETLPSSCPTRSRESCDSRPPAPYGS